MLQHAISTPGQANGLIHCPDSEGSRGRMPKQKQENIKIFRDASAEQSSSISLFMFQGVPQSQSFFLILEVLFLPLIVHHFKNHIDFQCPLPPLIRNSTAELQMNKYFLLLLNTTYLSVSSDISRLLFQKYNCSVLMLTKAIRILKTCLYPSHQILPLVISET